MQVPSIVGMKYLNLLENLLTISDLVLSILAKLVEFGTLLPAIAAIFSM